MSKKHKNLFDKIVNVKSFEEAFNRTAKGKRNSSSYLRFDEDRYGNLKVLRDLLSNYTYIMLPSRSFTIFEPKPRNITTLSFHDRVIQHAIYAVLNPILDKTFLPNSYACRKNKGSHKCASDLQSALRMTRYNYTWYLKTDFKKYFHRILLSVVWKELRKTISCLKTLHLLEIYVPKLGIGLNIGELLSQLLANVNGNLIDKFIKHTLGIKHFYRYMDDIVLLGNSYEELLEIKSRLEIFSKDIGLEFSKYYIKETSKGINFVGYIIFKDFRLIRPSSIKRVKRKLRVLADKPDELVSYMTSWYGHISHANSYNLKCSMNLPIDIQDLKALILESTSKPVNNKYYGSTEYQNVI